MKQAVIIGGPTASGKSSLAVSLARTLQGTVINADSLQVYNALPILTAQPSAQEQTDAPHALYGFMHPNDGLTAQSWRDAAITAMDDAHRHNRLPVIVGGTGFYINALLHGMSAIPAIPPTVRQQAQEALEAEGLPEIHRRLAAADPEGAARMDAQNPQRLARAYEVLLHTGKPISYWQAQPRQGAPEGWRFFTISLLPPRDDLHRNCAARITTMLAQGILDEVAGFSQQIANGDVSPQSPPTHACGYAPLAAHLCGDIPLQEALDAMLIDTRQYARRQDTWFRRQWQPDMALDTATDARAAEAVTRFLSNSAV